MTHDQIEAIRQKCSEVLLMAEDDGVLVTLRDWIYLHVHAKFPRGRFWLPHLKEYETFYVDAMREARIWSEALIDRARHGAPHDQ